MGILDNLMARAGYVKTNPQTEAPHLEDIAYAAMPYVDRRTLWANQAAAYRQSSWLYKAVSTLAKSAALVPISVYHVTGDGRREAVDNHPFEMLLRRPNPFMSRFEFMEATYSAWLISGNAFWYVRPNLAKTPGELWPLRPDRMTIIPDRKNFIHGYVHEVQGRATPFDMEEIAHFRFYHPLEDYEGLSPIEALAYALGNDTAAQEWNYSFFKNAAKPDIVMSSDQQISKPDFDRLRKTWTTDHQGQSKAHGTYFMTHGFKPSVLTSTQKDLDFIEGRKLSREEIWQVLSMPMGMWTENATEANAKVALRVFYNFGLWPALCAVADKITAQLLPAYGDDLIAEYEDIRITDRELVMAEEKIYAMTHTVNETRAQFHDDEPLVGGDVIVNAQGAIIVGISEKGTEPPPIEIALPEEEEPEEPEGLSEAELEAEAVELEKWQKWALSRMKREDWPPARLFEIKHVDSVRAAYVQAALSEAQTAQEVKAAFAAPFCSYP